MFLLFAASFLGYFDTVDLARGAAMDLGLTWFVVEDQAGYVIYQEFPRTTWV